MRAGDISVVISINQYSVNPYKWKIRNRRIINPLVPAYVEIFHTKHIFENTGELGYDKPLYDRLLSMTDDMLGPSPMHIKYLSYVYDRFGI